MHTRAKTYLPVARGKCVACGNTGVDLRFVFNTNGDDFLVCVPCGDAADELAIEDGHPDEAHPHGKTSDELQGEIGRAIEESRAAWPAKVRARFDRDMAAAREYDKQHEKNYDQN